MISRADALATFERERFDVVVIGGGITGAGVALDAASRGYSVALLERTDFAAGTSSLLDEPTPRGSVRKAPDERLSAAAAAAGARNPTSRCR